MSMFNRFPTRDALHRQRGATIVEAAVTFVVVAVALLAVLNFGSSAMRTNADASARIEAINLAESKLEELRGFISVGDYDASVVSGSATTSGETGTFTTTWATTGSNSLNVSVTVGWTDSANTAQSVTLATNIRRIDAADAGEDLRFAMLGSGGTTNWVDDGGDDVDTGGDGGDTDQGDPPDYDFPVDDPNWDTANNAYKLTVSGSVSRQGAADLIDFAIVTAVVAEDGDQYPNTCILGSNGNSYVCTIFYGVTYNGWAGTIQFKTNKVFCISGYPNTLNIYYTGLTDHVEQNLAVANNSRNCSGTFSIVAPGTRISTPST